MNADEARDRADEPIIAHVEEYPLFRPARVTSLAAEIAKTGRMESLPSWVFPGIDRAIADLAAALRETPEEKK